VEKLTNPEADLHKASILLTTHTVRVRYGETDRMGFVYYGAYAAYLEVARVELLRSLGMAYSVLEKRGIWLPVRTFNIRYHRPGHYDDLIEVEVGLCKRPTAKIEFSYRLSARGEVLAEAYTELAFLNAETGTPARCPADLLALIDAAYSKSSSG
jgi:acyl-CoA thioester hydrolase